MAMEGGARGVVISPVGVFAEPEYLFHTECL